MLNIQIRVLSREAQALLKQLEKEIAAVDKATNGSSTASKRLAIAQENLRNQTRALAAANRELAASQKASTTASNAVGAAIGRISAKELAYQRALMGSSSAVAKRDALLSGSAKRAGAAATAQNRIASATGRLEVASINLAAAERKEGIAQARLSELMAASDVSAGALAAAEERLTVAQETLRKAEIAGEIALQNMIAAEFTSAQSMAKAAAAAQSLEAAELNVAKALATAEAAAASLTAAHAAVAESQGAVLAADEAVTAASTEVSLAQEREVVAFAASAKAAQENAVAVRESASAANNASGSFEKSTKSLIKMGSQTQWMGRQLQTNFTTPILLAAGFATKFALDNQKAMVQLTKVYGNGTQSTAFYKKETDALAVSMRLLSEKFGVQQKEVIEIGAGWAAAGAEGVALAKDVQQTLRTMVVGEMSATDATKALISIQAQWGLSSKQLANTMNMLNAVENQTGVNLADLVTGFSRASGAARFAGVTQQQLAADLAALVPAAGSAAAAGNGLKTIYSRLLAPTNAAIDVLKAMNIQVDAQNWKSLTAQDRLKVLAEKYKNLSSAQRSAATAYLEGRFQLSRTEILLDALTKKEGYYQKALDATTTATQARKTADKELQAVLNSNPQKLKQLTVIAQNMAADLGTQLIPALMSVVSVLDSMLRVFNNLDPTTRKMIISVLLFVAVVGPLLRMLGAFEVLIGEIALRTLKFGMIFYKLGRILIEVVIAPFRLLASILEGLGGLFVRGFMFLKTVPTLFRTAMASADGFFGGLVAVLRGGLAGAARLLLSWPGLIVVAIATVLLLFRKQIAQTFSNLGNALNAHLGFISKIGAGIISVFNQLPIGIQNAMLAVVRIVHAAVMAVYNLFSYLNPFAHHSPSLVENVTKGMAKVQSEFAKLPAIAAPIKAAYADIKKFKDLTAGMMQGLDSLKRADDLKNVLKYAPSAAGTFRALVKDLQTMEPILDRLEAAQKKQQTVVDQWAAKVDKADTKLQKQKDILDALQKVADGYSQQLDAAQNSLDKFASTPIAGLKAMENAIFDNEQAQKQLQLQMMNMEDAVGPIDDLQSKMDALNGQIEVLTGEQKSLQSAGAGSDILSVYNDQIDALQSQQVSINDTAKQYDDLNKQLEQLQRTGERLDLTKSLNFDGLQKQIEDASSAIQEMPFEDIMAGISGAKADVDKYKTALDGANAKVAAQQTIVDNLQATYDALNAQHDVEQKKLDAITQKYNDMRDAISEVKSALDDVSGAANQAAQAGVTKKKRAGGGLSPSAQAFQDAAGGDFPIEGGTSGIGREGGIDDIKKFNDKLSKEMSKLQDSINIFEPIKKKWDQVKKWWEANVAPDLKGMMSDISKAFSDVDWSAPFKNADGSTSNFMKHLEGVGKFFQDAGKTIAEVLKLFMPELKQLGEQTISKIVKAFQTWKPQIDNIVTAIGRLWTGIKPVVAIIGVVLLGVLKVAAAILIEVFGRALDLVIDLVGDVLQVLSGLINFVAFIFTGDWSAAWDAVEQIVAGVFEAIYHVFEGAVSIVYGILKGFVDGIIGFFKWLWDELVGHSIIPDMITAIINAFLAMPGRIIAALAALGGQLVTLFKNAWSSAQSALGTAWSATKSWLEGLPQKMYNALTGALGLLGSAGRAILTAVWNGIKAIWEGDKGIAGWIGDKVQWIVDKFKALPGRMGGIFVGMFDGIKSAFKSVINWVIGAWNGLNFHIGIPDKVFGVSIPGGGHGIDIGTPDIGYLAKGGLVQKNALNIIGEQGPELFAPGVSGRVFSNSTLQDLVAAATKESLSRLNGAAAATAMRTAAPGQLAGMVAGADRRVSMASTPAAPVQATVVNNNTEYHFHGDLSFPNISDGKDAKNFLDNLETLARGQ